MLETKRLIETARTEARNLDQLLIDGRKPVVGRNLAQIEGRNRSEKYVSRLAGHSPDVYRKSASEKLIEFYGATVLEDPIRANLVSEFWRPILSHPNQQTIYINKSYWQIDEEIGVIMAHLRQAIVGASQLEAKFHLVQIRQKINEALAVVEQMPQF